MIRLVGRHHERYAVSVFFHVQLYEGMRLHSGFDGSRELGLVEEANRHYEETFRQLPSQFGFVASLCFGCAGIFDSPGAVPIAERILTEAAAGETPAPAVRLVAMGAAARMPDAQRAVVRIISLFMSALLLLFLHPIL